MGFSMNHTNICVSDPARSVAFYKRALGLEVLREIKSPDGAYHLTFVGVPGEAHSLELSWFSDKSGPYVLGDNPTHVNFRADDFEAARALHDEMGCVVGGSPYFGVYYIADPDGYVIEISPAKK